MSPSRIDGTGYFPSIVRTTGMRVARWMGIAVAWARVSPSRVKRLAEASSPSFTMVENELRTRVDCISFAMPSSLLRTTSRVIGSEAAGFVAAVMVRLSCWSPGNALDYPTCPPRESEGPCTKQRSGFTSNRWKRAASSPRAPNVPGLVAQGRSIAEAAETAQGLARKIAESCIEHGDPLPPALSGIPEGAAEGFMVAR